jgi:hypothetical protein
MSFLRLWFTFTFKYTVHTKRTHTQISKMSDSENVDEVKAAPKVKKPRTEKQLAATAALVARNKQKKAERQAQKDAEAAEALQAVNMKISEIAGDSSDYESGSDLEAPPQKESETEESESDSSESGSGSDSGGLSSGSDESKEEEREYSSDEESNEDEPAETYKPKDFTSELKDGGYMTHLERANVETKRKRPLHKGLLSSRW